MLNGSLTGFTMSHNDHLSVMLATIYSGFFFLTAKVRYISLLQENLCCQTHQPD